MLATSAPHVVHIASVTLNRRLAAETLSRRFGEGGAGANVAWLLNIIRNMAVELALAFRKTGECSTSRRCKHPTP
jgi:hypothetical protein